MSFKKRFLASILFLCLLVLLIIFKKQIVNLIGGTWVEARILFKSLYIGIDLAVVSISLGMLIYAFRGKRFSERRLDLLSYIALGFVFFSMALGLIIGLIGGTGNIEFLPLLDRVWEVITVTSSILVVIAFLYETMLRNIRLSKK